MNVSMKGMTHFYSIMDEDVALFINGYQITSAHPAVNERLCRPITNKEHSQLVKEKDEDYERSITPQDFRNILERQPVHGGTTLPTRRGLRRIRPLSQFWPPIRV